MPKILLSLSEEQLQRVDAFCKKQGYGSTRTAVIRHAIDELIGVKGMAQPKPKSTAVKVTRVHAPVADAPLPPITAGRIR